jgi:hypothetical protein
VLEIFLYEIGNGFFLFCITFFFYEIGNGFFFFFVLNFSLAYKKVKLEDEKALIDYNVILNSTMELLPKIQILVRTPASKKVPLQVNGGDYIGSIQQQLAEKEGSFLFFFFL